MKINKVIIPREEYKKPIKTCANCGKEFVPRHFQKKRCVECEYGNN